jgi:hypothetical protein
MKLTRIALFSLTVVVATSASAQVVQNGSFESFTGTFGSDNGAQLIGSSTTLIGWTIIGGEIAILKDPNAYNLTASDGMNFLDLAGYSNGGFPKGVSQVLTGLSVGQTYTVSMDLGIRNGACVSGGNNCRGPIQVSASVAGTSQTFTHSSTTDGNVWDSFSSNFVANESSALLTIQGLNLPAGNQYIGLDNVSVSPVPEPTSWGLMLAGLVTVGVMVRTRRADKRQPDAATQS